MKTDRGTEIPARTSLGATTVLSVVTIGFGGKSKPQVTKKEKKIVNFIFFFFQMLQINFDRSLLSSCTNAWGTDNKISLSQKKKKLLSTFSRLDIPQR